MSDMSHLFSNFPPPFRAMFLVIWWALPTPLPTQPHMHPENLFCFLFQKKIRSTLNIYFACVFPACVPCCIGGGQRSTWFSAHILGISQPPVAPGFVRESDTFFWILQVLTCVCTYPPYICIHINDKINLNQKITRTFLLIWQLRRWEEGSKVMRPQWMSDLQGEIFGSLCPAVSISLPSPAFHPVPPHPPTPHPTAMLAVIS